MILRPGGAAVRIAALVCLVVLVGLVAFGIEYVPRHDGRAVDGLLLVVLPAAGAGWCLAKLLPHPGQTERRKGR